PTRRSSALILETFSFIEEILLAVDAIRSFSGLPIVAQLTYSEEGTTHGDIRPSDAAAQLKSKNVQVIGANCTLGPQALLPILQEDRKSTRLNSSHQIIS